MEKNTYNTRRVGKRYEDVAAKWLESEGYRLLHRNYRVARGEIDIVASKDGYVVFVEVKYRSGKGSGSPEEAVDYRKQRQISRVALYYLNNYGYGTDTPVRFDVVTVSRNDKGDLEIRHIENAFDYGI